MLKRYIGSVPEVEVVVAGNSYGAVKTGEAIAIPDDVANAASWPEENWEDDGAVDPPTDPPTVNEDDDNKDGE